MVSNIGIFHLRLTINAPNKCIHLTGIPRRCMCTVALEVATFLNQIRRIERIRKAIVDHFNEKTIHPFKGSADDYLKELLE